MSVAGARWPPSRFVLFAMPTDVVTSRAHHLRTFLIERQCVRWLIYFGREAAGFLGYHRAVQVMLLGVTTDPPNSSKAFEAGRRLARLVDLRHEPAARWAEIVVGATKRGGDERHSSIVLRHVTEDRPWTYDPFASALARTPRRCVSGRVLRPLGELAHVTVGGVTTFEESSAAVRRFTNLSG